MTQQKTDVLNVPVYSISGEIKGEVSLPKVFSAAVRKDLIKRAFLASFTAQKQPKGRDPLAGRKVSVKSFGTGREMARLPRHSSGRAGFAPMARGGYKPHPSRIDENIREEINQKERVLALGSAIAATGQTEFVVRRGHRFDGQKIKALPIVLSDELEGIDKTRDAFFLIQQLGLAQEVERVKYSRKVRAGRGKLRNRRIKQRKGPLIVVSKNCAAIRAFRNIPGFEIVSLKSLGVIHLAPGGDPGRLTLWAESTLKMLDGSVSYERRKTKA
jgi:large subunit ribosomal protein L4e